MGPGSRYRYGGDALNDPGSSHATRPEDEAVACKDCWPCAFVVRFSEGVVSGVDGCRVKGSGQVSWGRLGRDSLGMLIGAPHYSLESEPSVHEG